MKTAYMTAVLSGLILFTSCGGTTVRTVTDEDWLNRPVSMDRNRPLPAQLSSHLSFLGMDGRYLSEPWETLVELDQQWRAYARPVDDPALAERHAVLRKGISYVLAAAAYQHGVSLVKPGQEERQVRAMTTALVAAYTFLFEPSRLLLAEMPEALDERTNDAREIYNRSLAWLALHRQRTASERAEAFTLPLIRGTLHLKRGANQLPYPWESARRFDACYALHGVANQAPVIQRGLGAPMAIRFEQRASTANLVCSATVLLRLDAFPGEQEAVAGEWLILDPLRNTRYPLIDGRPPVRLEADLTTPLQVLASELPDPQRSSGFFNGDQVVHLAGITMLEPYVPGRIPLIVVHGTMSTPQAWLPFFAGLRGDPWLRDRYQVWFFRYPTSNPVPVSATMLRDAIAAQVRRLDPQDQDPAMRNMVMFGHSMGGLVARMVLIDSDDRLRQAMAPDLPAGTTSTLLDRCTTFTHQDRIKRVVYIGTPHRGVDLLDAFWLNDAARWLELPQESADLAALVGKVAERTSLHTMRPGSRLLTWLATKPDGIGVQVHSILGELGSGDDGMVSKTSAHLDGAASELILPVNHGQIYTSGAAVAELRRILDLHLQKR